MQTYFAYGLGIRSPIPMPELLPHDGPPDVEIRLAPVGDLPRDLDRWGSGLRATATEACYFRKDVGAFLVRDGREIVIDRNESVEERVVRLSILGPAMALVLHQRGRMILHASSVEVNGRAVALMGGHGWGKSTMAATLSRRGHRLISDDVTSLDMAADPPLAYPSYPQFKLWPDAADRLTEDSESLPRLHPDVDKLAYRVPDGFSGATAPLSHAYALARGDAVASEVLAPQEALKEVMRHWYGGRFGRGLLEATGVARHFRTCSVVADRVTIRRLSRPPALDGLDELARIIERDVENAPHLARSSKE